VTPAFFLRTLARESRGSRGRLAFFVACLSVGVAAVVSVAGISASLDDGIRGEARQLLAADLAIQGRRPIPPGLDLARAGLAGAGRTDLQETVTVVAAPPRAAGHPGRSQLVELKVVDGDYPFYGKLVIEPARPLRELLAPGTTVVAAELLARLGLRVGDALRIGGRPFRIAGIVTSEPDRISVSMTLGPRVFLNGEGFRRAGLGGPGSRITYRTLLKAPEGFPSPASTRSRNGCSRRSPIRPSTASRPTAMRNRRCAAASTGSSASSAWWRSSRSSWAASASPRACAPGSPAGWTRSPS